MPPEPLPWDRKDFFKERKHDRWREPTPHHHYTSSRWNPDYRSRATSGEFLCFPSSRVFLIFHTLSLIYPYGSIYKFLGLMVFVLKLLLY